MLLIGAIALIAIGPKQLPDVARTVGRFLNQVKRATSDFQQSLTAANDSATREISELHKALNEEIVPPIGNGHHEPLPQQSLFDVRADQAVASQPNSNEGDEHKQLNFDFEKKES